MVLCLVLIHELKYTVNSEIFARVSFSRNFADEKFRKIKFYQNGKITLSFTEVGKSGNI